MAKYGFVYVLGNDCMPDVYKVGCTERSPLERAEELSKPTGVPAPFSVLCYIEVADFQKVEADFHRWLDDYRVSHGREFFRCPLRWLVSLMYYHPKRASFCDASEMVISDPKYRDSCSELRRAIGIVDDFTDLDDPFGQKQAPAPAQIEEAPPEAAHALKLVQGGGLE